MVETKQKIILIAGANGKLGKIFAKYLDDLGHILILIDKDKINYSDSLKNKNSIFNQIDLNSIKDFEKNINLITNKFGKLDAAINAVYPKSEKWGTKFEDLELEIVNKHLNLQLGLHIIFAQRIINLFISQGYGNLINISSIMGISSPKFSHYEGTQMSSPIEYTVSKSGIISFTKYLAKYYKNKNIRVNCISPGGIFENQDKTFVENYKKSCCNKGLLDPIDICGTLNFLLSDDSKYINGQNIIVDDGWSL
tara:strand:- start:30250 stop:31005 length:756 start_codon:yes stop_codon:yes gene_type:complete